MTLKEQIEQRLAELRVERERRAQEAQRADYAYAAVIGELDRLLKQDEVKEQSHGL